MFLANALNNCLATHAVCRENSSAEWLPTRLLDVGNPAQISNTVKVVEREDILSRPNSQNISYLTLSHKWGQDKILTLSQKNIEELKHSIPIANLIPCFQDAISVTRRLGFQYIWIDSLWYESSFVSNDLTYDMQYTSRFRKRMA